jgi:hypothetical protein
MLAGVAADRHNLAEADKNHALSEQAARSYTLFNPVDSTGWTNLVSAGRLRAVNLVEMGRLAEAERMLREAAALEHDPRNKTGVDGSIYFTWRIVEALAAQRGDLPAARAALTEIRRVAPLVVQGRNMGKEFADVTDLMVEVFEYDILALGNDYATIYARAADVDARLRKLALTDQQVQSFRDDAVRRNAGWLAEAALRVGQYEAAAAVTRQTLDRPIAGRLNQAALDDFQARARVRLGQAQLGSGQRAEAVATLEQALAYYRKEQAEGAKGTGPRQDLARALYWLAQAQAGDEASVARRATLLAEAAGVLDGLTLEAQQMLTSRELIEWIAAARAKG